MKNGVWTGLESIDSWRDLIFQRWLTIPGFIPWMLSRKVLEIGRFFLTGGWAEGTVSEGLDGNGAEELAGTVAAERDGTSEEMFVAGLVETAGRMQGGSGEKTVPLMQFLWSSLLSSKKGVSENPRWVEGHGNR